MRVGREGQGFRIAMQTLDSARPFVASVAVGVAQSALDIAAHYARGKKTVWPAHFFLPAHPGHGGRYGHESPWRPPDGPAGLLDA